MRKFWRFATGTRRRKVISVVAVLALIASGTALAIWYSASGSGSANGTFASSGQAVTLTVTGVSGGNPVSPTAMGTVKFDVTSTVAQTLNVLTISQAGPFVVTAPNCSPAEITTLVGQLSLPDLPLGAGSGLTIPATPGVAHFVTNVALNAAAPACAIGGSFTVPVTVTAS